LTSFQEIVVYSYLISKVLISFHMLQSRYDLLSKDPSFSQLKPILFPVKPTPFPVKTNPFPSYYPPFSQLNPKPFLQGDKEPTSGQKF
jgi:hypothetical protein